MSFGGFFFFQFKSLLEKSAFVSIDTEFSGLTVTPDQVPGYKDSVKEYYRKKASAITQFAVLQIGICLWVPDATSDSLVAYVNCIVRVINC